MKCVHYKTFGSFVPLKYDLELFWRLLGKLVRFLVISFCVLSIRLKLIENDVLFNRLLLTCLLYWCLKSDRVVRLVG